MKAPLLVHALDMEYTNNHTPLPTFFHRIGRLIKPVGNPIESALMLDAP